MNAKDNGNESTQNNTPGVSGVAHAHSAERANVRGLLRRAMSSAISLAPRLADQMKGNPYAVVAGAFLVGGSLGIVLSSRILRAVLTATATAGALEFMRGLAQQSTPPTHAT